MTPLKDPFASFVGFEWDGGNSEKNWHTHQVTIAEAEQVFLNRPVVMATAPYRGEAEPRFALLGLTNGGRGLFVVFTPRGDRIRVISARPMSRAERRTDEQTTKATSQDDPEIQE